VPGRHGFGASGELDKTAPRRLEAAFRQPPLAGTRYGTLYQFLHSDFLRGSGLTDSEECRLLRRCCRFCQQVFEPSKFHSQQSVCGRAECQRQRRTEYHRRRIAADTEYAEGVRDSQRKWRESHPDYQKAYRQSHPTVVQRNRQLQQGRDAQRRVQFLVKNNLALDLKRCTAEVWLVGPAARDLVKNNLAPCQMFIFQPLARPATTPPTS
jgi:hypothetical protein